MPYKWSKPTAFFHVFNPKMPLNYVLRHTDVSIYGWENLKINQIKYKN